MKKIKKNNESLGFEKSAIIQNKNDNNKRYNIKL